MRCARCGNENLAGNRFCGMCGTTLLEAPAAVVPVPTQGAATRPTPVAAPVPSAPVPSTPAPPPIAVAPRTPAPATETVPLISGPSFLGLNDPPPAPRRRGSLSIDPNSAPSSGNLDYLLEDDEQEQRSGGAWKFILIVLALALAVGLGYLRWKNQGFGWLGSNTHKPAAAAQNSDVADTSSATSPAPTGTAAPASGVPPATDPNTPAATAPPGTPAATNSTTTAANPTTNPAAGSAAAGAAPATPDGAAANGATNAPADSAAAPSPAAKAPAPDTPPAAIPKPQPAAPAPLAKPHAALKPVAPFDPVSEAQKYLYGKGVTQNCDHGLRLLKPATDQGNPKAMIEMGALYSAGLCTPHDLPTAYRWFALALRKDPDNQAVQGDLEKLWGEMTQPERQLAIKLSQ